MLVTNLTTSRTSFDITVQAHDIAGKVITQDVNTVVDLAPGASARASVLNLVGPWVDKLRTARFTIAEVHAH